ncbi:MAG: MFS transporter [Planctomycetes bacterium]|nr:MFS transporter [Planctomycetota bacterium]
MGALYFFSYFHRVAIPGTIFNELQSDMAFSASAVTALGAIFLYVYAGVQPLVGIMADRWGGTRVLIIGGTLMCIGSIVFPLAQSTAILYSSRALIGLGAGCMYLSLIKEIDTHFALENFSTFLGALIFMGYAGGLAGTFPFERATQAFGWRRSLLFIGIFSAIVLIFSVGLLIKLRGKSGDGPPFSLQSLGKVVRNYRAYPVLFAGSFNWAIYFLVQTTVGKKFLQDVAGLSSSVASAYTLVMMAVAMLMALLWGLFSRLIGNRRRPLIIACPIATSVAAVIVLGGILSGAPSWLFLTCYAVFAASAACAPVFAASMKELNPSDTVALSVSIQNTVAYLVVGILANGVGLVLDAFATGRPTGAKTIIYPDKAYIIVFVGIIGLALVATLLSLLAPETHGKPSYRPTDS